MHEPIPEHLRIEPGQAQDMAHEFNAKATIEGAWVAICKCGHVVGMCLAGYTKGKPSAEYNVSPYCDCKGRDGDIKYVWDGPEGMEPQGNTL
jgi:hypothetical protein